MGPNVQKVKAGVRIIAGCAVIALVAFLRPRVRQRVPKAYEDIHMLVICNLCKSDDASSVFQIYLVRGSFEYCITLEEITPAMQHSSIFNGICTAAPPRQGKVLRSLSP